MGGGRRWEVGLKNRWDLGLVRGVHLKLPQSFSVLALGLMRKGKVSNKQIRLLSLGGHLKFYIY